MSRIRERIYIPAGAFEAYDASHQNLGDSTCILAQVTSRPLYGLKFGAVSDIGYCRYKLPIFYNPDFDLGIRLNWTSGSSTSADTIDWTTVFEFVKTDNAIPTSISKVLDTIIAQDTVGAATAFLNKWTSRGIIDKDNSEVPTREQVEAGVDLLLKNTLSATAIDVASEIVWLLGIEIDFVRLDFVGSSGFDEVLSSIET